MAKPITHVMLDFETLAIGPKAAPIQAGIVYRTAAGNFAEFEFTCSPEKYRDHSGTRFTVDQNTINFHHRENPENFRTCTESPNSIVEFATAIRTAIEGAKNGGTHAIWLWSCGTDFDIPILNNLMIFAGLKPNWAYSNVRDYRTLRELYKDSVPKNYINDHSALGDARNQHLHLLEILDKIGEQNG